MTEFIRTRATATKCPAVRQSAGVSAGVHHYGPANPQSDGPPISRERIALVCDEVRLLLTLGRWSDAAEVAESARGGEFVWRHQPDGPRLYSAAAEFVAGLVDVHLQSGRVYGAVAAIQARRRDPSMRDVGELSRDSLIELLDVSVDTAKRLRRTNVNTIGQLADILDRAMNDQGNPSGAFSGEDRGTDAECTECLWFIGLLGPRRTEYWERQKRQNLEQEPAADIEARRRRELGYRAEQARRKRAKLAQSEVA